MTMATILLVDDDPSILESLATLLTEAGFVTTSVESGEQALHWLTKNDAHLLLLDCVLPGIGGVELTRRLRNSSRHQTLPIIILSARNDEDDKVSALEAGVDDYVVKPFSSRELIGRIKAVLRRQLHRQNEVEQLVIGDWVLDTEQHQLLIAGEKRYVNSVEFKLLRFLMLYPDKAHSRQQLLEAVWERNIYIEERTVDVQIGRLRKLLDEYGFGDAVQTVRGLGYRLSTDYIAGKNA